jgi:hypothetical protein
MSELTCQACGTTFSKKSNLERHQKKALYCLEMKNGGVKTRKEVEAEIRTHKCEFCDRSYMDKATLIRHHGTCVRKSTSLDLQEKLRKMELETKILEARLEDRDKTIRELRLQLAEKEKSQERVTLTAIARPMTNTRQTIKNLQINNLQPITEADMKAALPMLTSDHIRAGGAGYARYALEYPLKDKVAVLDASRRKIAWRSETGSLINDTEGTELSSKFFAVVKDPSLKAIRELMNELNERHDIAQDAKDEQEIAICDVMLIQLDDLRRDLRKTIAGEPTPLKQEFVKEICTTAPPNPEITLALQGLPGQISLPPHLGQKE